MPREHFSNILVEHRVHYDCIMTVLQNVFLYLLIFLWFFCDAYKFIDTCLLMFCNLPGNKYTNENTNTYLLTYVALRMYRHQWRVWWAARFVESRITCLPGNHWPWLVLQDQCLSSRQLSTSSASTQLPLCSTWSWCHTPSKRQTKKQTDLQSDTSVFLSVVSVTGVHPMSGRSAMLHRNFRGITNYKLGIDQ